ncbi:MAG TPA: PEGA domain-containing protein [Candidatus Deferrimicrobiaceae bacterium]|nr:PEGA domain-containing protein [Candidatus Deferrimicrobiaceae bacterium]
MSLRVLVVLVPLLVAGAASGAPAADIPYMGHAVHGYSGYSLGGALYINAFPHFAEVSLDGKRIGVANDLQAALVDARVGVHALTVTAPGYEPATVLVRVVRDWTTRVRLQLVPAR